MARDFNSRDDYCFACGKDNPIGLHLEFKFDGDKYTTKKTLPREYQSYDGILHGGIITTLLDEAMGGYIIDKYKKTAMTGRLEVRYRQPTKIGDELTINAWQEAKRKNIITMKAEIVNSEGSVTAEASAKMAVVER